MANGIFVVPVENELITFLLEGIKYPTETPMAIARKIQSVRQRSKNPRRFLSFIGKQLFIDIKII